MTPKPCSRLWQAEAVLDGVLSRADQASFERHVATCSECAAERASLLRLVRVAQRLPVLEAPPLRRRALRNELLRRANALSTGSGPRRSWRFYSVLPIAACALSMFALLVFRRAPTRALEATSAPVYQLVAGANTRWRVTQPGRAFRLSLELGELTIAVNKLGEGQRFVVALPDGELEVHGTRFVVACDGQRTQRVSVSEGRVALRLNAQGSVSLGAGDAWTMKEAAPATPATPAANVAPNGASLGLRSATLPSATPASERALPQRAGKGTSTSPARRATPGSTSSAPPSPRQEAAPAAEAAPSPAASAAREFAEAMAVFSRGDFGSAERLFAAFEERYPRSPHVEDLLFLKALGRSRRGDFEGARRLALEYLRRYPGGFRSVEAERLAAPRAGLAAQPGLVHFPSE